MPRQAPTAAHHALMLDLHAVDERYKSVPALERVALVSQFLGMLLSEVPSAAYSQAQVMATVSRNMEIGNEQAAGITATVLEG